MSASLIADNLLRPFQLERSTLRGRVVRLGDLVDQVLTRHDYPEPVGRLLGELFVLAATLAGGLKFDGTFSLQTGDDKGAASGWYRVTVASLAGSGTSVEFAPTSLIPDKYRDPQLSLLQCEVKANRDNHLDFNLD